MKIRIGTRGSQLALWQANHIASKLGPGNCEIIIIKTQGDKIQNVSFDKMEGKAFFTKELEDSLLANSIDLAVHSLKDLPTESVAGLRVAAVPERENSSDMLLMNSKAYEEHSKLHLRRNACVGTSSLRRVAQIKALRKDLTVDALRGNINTRIQKLRDGKYDAIVLAYAGIKRIDADLTELETLLIPHEQMLPAPAQGALGLQIREEDENLASILEPLHHLDTWRAVHAERTFLRNFEGGCHVPLGALAKLDGELIHLQGIVAAIDGSHSIRESMCGKEPESLGRELAHRMKDMGADDLL